MLRCQFQAKVGDKNLKISRGLSKTSLFNFNRGESLNSLFKPLQINAKHYEEKSFAS